LATLVKDSYDAITIQDLEGRILAWNPAAERMYGWSEAEALAMNIRELIPAGLYEDHLEKIKALGQADILEPYHTKKIAKNGRVVDILLTATALVNNAGQIYAIATTERKME
jgi:two-component system CheB/CheR fusion protein